MFDSYEGNTEDYSNLKSDNREHARTSIESLKRFTREMAATPVDTVKRKQIKAWMRDPRRRAPNKAQYWPEPNTLGHSQLDDARAWLFTYGNELPAELENEQGRSGGKAPVVQGDYDLDPINASKYERHGLMFMGEQGCYESLESIANGLGEYARANPTSHGVRLQALSIRCDRYRKHAARQAAAARWRGMEGYDASAKADEDMAAGLFRAKRESGAKPLPPIARLHELFRVEDGKLIRTAAVRGGKIGDEVTGRDVRVDGEKHKTARVIYAMETGEDAGTKMVRGSVATHYRGAEGSVRETQYGWEARIKYGTSKDVTVGVYPNEEQAQLACTVYLRSLEMGSQLAP